MGIARYRLMKSRRMDFTFNQISQQSIYNNLLDCSYLNEDALIDVLRCIPTFRNKSIENVDIRTFRSVNKCPANPVARKL